MSILRSSTASNVLISILIVVLIVTFIPMNMWTDNVSADSTSNPTSEQAVGKKIKSEDLSEENVIEEELTENTTTYDLGNGMWRTVFHGGDVRFENKKGELVDYDATLVPIEPGEKSMNKNDLSGYLYKTNVGDRKNYIPEEISKETPLLLEYEKYEIRFNPTEKTVRKTAEELGDVQLETEELPALYEEKVKSVTTKAIYLSDNEDITFEYESGDTGIKENIILSEIPGTNTFEFDLDLKGMYPRMNPWDTGVTFYDIESDEIIAAIDAPFMNDATGEAFNDEDISYELKKIDKDNGIYKLVLTVDEKYLTDDKRVYPIKIDPTFTWKATSGDWRMWDSYICNGSAYKGTNFHSSGVVCMAAGKGTKGVFRTYLQFNTVKTQLKTISVQKAELFAYETGDSTSGVTVNVHRVIDSWAAGSVTWNNRATFAASTVQGSSKTTGTQGKQHKFIVTPWAKGLSNDSYESHGIIMVGSDETVTKLAQFYSSRHSTANTRPTLAVEYAPKPTPPKSVTVTDPIGPNTIAKLTFETAGNYPDAKVTSYKYRIAQYNTSGVLVNSTYKPYTTATSGVTLQTLPEGKYICNVKAIDNNGWESTDKPSSMVTVDRTAPNLSSAPLTPAYDQNGWYRSQALPSIKWTGLTDTPAYTGNKWKLQYSVDKVINTLGTTIPISSTRDLTAYGTATSGTTALQEAAFKEAGQTAIASGKYIIKLHAVDNVGNSRHTHTFDYWRDTEKPKLELKIKDNTGTTIASSTGTTTVTDPVRGTINTNALIDEPIPPAQSGINTNKTTLILKNMDTGETDDYTSFVNTSTNCIIDTKTYDDGSYALIFNGEDNAGNKADVVTLNFRIANQLPYPVFWADDYYSKTNEFTVNWYFNVLSGSLNDIEYAVVGEEEGEKNWQSLNVSDITGSAIINTPLDSQGKPVNGDHTIYIRGIDKYGEPGSETSLQVTVSNETPSVEISSFDAGILSGTVGSDLLSEWSVYVKEKGKSDDTYLLAGKGEYTKKNESITYIDMSKPITTSEGSITFTPGAILTFKLEAENEVSNSEYDTIDVIGGVDPGEMNKSGGIGLSDENTVPVITKGAFTFDMDNMIAPVNPLFWYLDGKFDVKTSVNSPSFTDDFSNTGKYKEGSYHTLTASATTGEAIGSSSLVSSGGILREYNGITTDDGFKYKNGTIGHGIFSAFTGSGDSHIITPELIPSYPVYSFKLSSSANLTGGADVKYHASLDKGKTWEEVPLGTSVKVSGLAGNKLYTSSLLVKAEFTNGNSGTASLNTLKINADFIKPQIFKVSFLDPFEIKSFSVRDRIDYKVYMQWKAKEKAELPNDISYEVISSSHEGQPTKDWDIIAEGLKEKYFSPLNLEFSIPYSYKIRAVRTEEIDEQVYKYYGKSTEGDKSKAADENEFAKFLGKEDYWQYEDIISPVGNVSVEKSKGNLVFTQTDKDISLNSFMGDAVTRTYNSQSSLVFPFGIGTDFALNIELLKLTGDSSTDGPIDENDKNSYVMKDSDGTLRIFDYDNKSKTYFTKDSKRVGLNVLNEPKSVKILTKKGTGSEQNTYDVRLIKFIITTDKKTEYWFNQGGQLVYITSKAEQLDTKATGSALGVSTGGIEYEYVADEQLSDMSLYYAPDSGVIETASVKGLYNIHFDHDEDNLITGVWLPDETAISYDYQDKRLEGITLHSEQISESEFLDGRISLLIPNTDDISYSYSYINKGHGQLEKQYMNKITGATGKKVEFEYAPASSDYGDMEQVISAKNAAGDETVFTYNASSASLSETMIAKTPYDLNVPNYANKTKFNLTNGLATESYEGTPDEISGGTAERTLYDYLNFYLRSTSYDAEYHEVTSKGAIETLSTERISKTTNFNELELPTVEVYENNSKKEITYGESGTINEEEIVSEMTYDENDNLTDWEKWDFNDNGYEEGYRDIVQETKEVKEYKPNGNLLRTKNYLVSYDDNGIEVGTPVLQSMTEYDYDDHDNVKSEITGYIARILTS